MALSSRVSASMHQRLLRMTNPSAFYFFRQQTHQEGEALVFDDALLHAWGQIHPTKASAPHEAQLKACICAHARVLAQAGKEAGHIPPVGLIVALLAICSCQEVHQILGHNRKGAGRCD